MELMDHKKEFHPSNKRCRKFENRMCRFGNKCWYVHEEELTNTNGTKEPENVKFECYLCGDVSNTIDDLKKHRKRTHPTYVKICEKFLA